MRAVRYHEHGGPEVLVVEDVDPPEPGGHEVLVRVRAAAVNPVDTYFRAGSYEPYALPMIPGADLAGVVEETGDGTPGFEEGDRVFATGLGRDHPGTYAEYAAVPIDRVAVLPESVPFDVGAAVALVGVTAWRALVDHAALEPAERCLVHGGNGGVGHVAVQLAATVGAEVITTAAPEYHERLETLGADAIFDYGRDDLLEAIEPYEPSVVLDHMLDRYLQFDAAVAGHGARIVGIGSDVPEAGFENVGAARGKETRWHFMSMFNTPSMSQVLDRLATLLAAGRLTAVVHRRFDLEAAEEAQRVAMEESFLGKVVLVP